jgi:hypothetical protein
MRKATLVALGAATLLFGFPSAVQGAEPADVQIKVDFNVYTQAGNHWQGTGAIQDEGTIKHQHSEVFNGSSAAVTDSPEGTKGTFTWTFHRTFVADRSTPGLLKSSGGWRMLSGTGAYLAIAGEGTMTGSLNTITGQLHDEFVGKVALPHN